jgi:hypothetical protein
LGANEKRCCNHSNHFKEIEMYFSVRIKVVILLGFVLALAACDAGAPEPTATPVPSETFTPAPTETQTPEPTATPMPTDTPTEAPTETETPEPTATIDPASLPFPMPQSEPLEAWNEIPIMEGAFVGDDNIVMYMFLIYADFDEITEYYEQEMGALGWEVSVISPEGGQSLVLQFRKDNRIVKLAGFPANETLSFVMIR